MGGGSSKKQGAEPVGDGDGAAAGGQKATFSSSTETASIAQVCQPASSPAAEPDEWLPRRSREMKGGVLRTTESYDETSKARNNLSQDEADMERLSRTVWIGNIPLNYAIPEKLMEVFEATAVPQVAQIRVKEARTPGQPQFAWGLLTFKYPDRKSVV